MHPPGDTRLWHPFAEMGSVRRSEVVLARGDDVWVFDAEGCRYLDATASLWYANVGHGREEIHRAQLNLVQASLRAGVQYQRPGRVAKAQAKRS